jgi:hypothetical protein
MTLVSARNYGADAASSMALTLDFQERKQDKTNSPSPREFGQRWIKWQYIKVQIHEEKGSQQFWFYI